MGIFIALTVIALWLLHLIYTLLFQAIDPTQVSFWLHILLQSWLSTGLFITAHDAMHGTVARPKMLNTIIGYVSTMLYAAMDYGNLRKNHVLHHQFPGSEKDPDYTTGNQNFFVWWYRFMTKYLTIWQIVIMALIFNILPHRLPHSPEMGVHRSRTLRKNHLYAFLSCYFFGYHAEHHALPHVPWWKLYQTKRFNTL